MQYQYNTLLMAHIMIFIHDRMLNNDGVRLNKS